MGVLSGSAGRTWFRTAPSVVALGVIALGLIAPLVLALVAYREAYRDRVYPGVAVAGVSLGGLTRAESEAALAEKLAPTLERPVVVEARGQRWQFSRPSLGARYDVSRLAEAAFAVGRVGPLPAQLLATISLRFWPTNIDPTVQLGAADWRGRLGPIAAQLDRPALDARLVVTPAHQIELIPDQPGEKLDLVAAERLIALALVAGANDPIQLPLVPVEPTIRAADLEEPRRQLQRALSGPVALADAGQVWLLSVDEIQRGIDLASATTKGAGPPTLRSDALDAFLDRIAADLDRSALDARLTLQGERVILEPGRTSRRLVREETAARIQAALLDETRTVTPVVDEQPPGVREEDLADALALANTLVGAPIVIAGPGQRTWTLAPAILRQMLVLPGTGSAASVPPHLDQQKVADFVAKLAKEVDRQPLNARFQRQPDGGIQLLHDGTPGQQVDQAAASKLIVAAAEGSSRQVVLPVLTIAPAITAPDAALLAGARLIVENTTSYAGSIPPRKHNVELATSLLNGVVVGPGEIFSFLHELGPTTLDRGFQVGYGIEAQGDAVKTVPSVAGGICQVATTLFQPIFWTGYTIEERYPHAYWIAHYVSRGLVGIDTTVDWDAGLDFRFKNDTTTPLLIQTSTDGTNVHFALYGTPPTWTVKVDPPVISNVVKTDPKPVVQHDPTLPKGQQVITEAAQDGFTVTIHRLVTYASGTTRELNLRAVYAPSHNVVLVGTR